MNKTIVLKSYFVSSFLKAVKIQVSVFKMCGFFFGFFIVILLFLQNNVTPLKRIVNIRKKKLETRVRIRWTAYFVHISCQARLHYEFIKYQARFFSFKTLAFRKCQMFSIILIIPAVRIYHGEGGRTKTKQSCRDFY